MSFAIINPSSNISSAGNTTSLVASSAFNTLKSLTAGSGVTITNDSTTVTIDSSSSSTIPPGTVIDFAGSSIPSGWLLCDGSFYGITAYPNLYAVIGTTYGAASLSFAVPDCRGRSSIGTGQGGGLSNRTLAQTGGVETVTLSILTMPNHNHVVLTDSSSPGTTSPTGNYLAGANIYKSGFPSVPSNLASSTIQNEGGGQAHENMTPFIVFNKIIKT